ncbi:MAG: GAF domain-containing protein [Bacteroidota bacterium]|nr:GAF domain-containing protein [Bacteroidota bacterium]
MKTKKIIKTASEDNKLIKGYGLTQRLNTLIEITLQIDSVGSRAEIYDILRKESKWLMEFDVLSLAYLSPVRSFYSIVTLSPIADATGLNETYFSVEEGLPGWVIRNQSPVICNAKKCVGHSNSVEGKFEEFGIKSFLAVPIRSGQDQVGALIFASVNEDNYTEDDLVIAQLYGLQIAVSLKNTNFVEDAKKRITQIESTNEISKILNSTLDIDDLLVSTAEAIQQNFNYFDVTLFLLSEENSELLLKAHSGNYLDLLPGEYRQNIGEGIIGWVAEQGEYILANDVSQDPRYKSIENHNTRSELALPIKVGAMLVGVLNIEDKKLFAFDEMDVLVLQTLCDQIASAIANAKLYEEIKLANQKLTELDSLKSEFISIVSHDFRSPLSSIILAGKALLKNEDIQNNPRFKEYMQLIVTQANRLNQLAEDTLSITRIESGQVSIAFKVVNVERLIQDALVSVRTSNRHTITYNIDPNASFIKGDHPKLRQVVQNLLSNAIKYSPAGGKVTINVVEQDGDEILFIISDEGIGIKSEYQDKLFQKFSRVDEPDSKHIKGTGLGLWICREIIEAHKGKIWIESEYGKGSTFKFTIKKSDS